MLLAIAAEFRPVAAGRVSFRLDELARTLFDVAAARDARAASHRLATLLTDELGSAPTTRRSTGCGSTPRSSGAPGIRSRSP